MDLKEMFSKNENELEEITDEFKINTNILEFRNRIVQISNIESVSIVEPAKKGFNNRVIIGFIIGLAAIAFQILIGIAILALCAFYVYSVSNSNKNLGKNIYINLVSGYYIFINCKDTDFAKRIVSVLKDYLNGANTRPVFVNINDSNVTFGEKSPINEGER